MVRDLASMPFFKNNSVLFLKIWERLGRMMTSDAKCRQSHDEKNSRLYSAKKKPEAVTPPA